MTHRPGRSAATGPKVETLLAWALISSFFGSAFALTPANLPKHSIKLMTYNIQAWRDASHQCNFDRIVEVVKEVSPQILCLNEVLHPFARPSVSDAPTQRVVDDYYQQVKENQGRNKAIDPLFIPSEESSFLRRLSSAADLPNIQFVGATDNSSFGQGVEFGSAVLSAYPLMEYLPVLLPAEKGDIDLGNQKRAFVEPRSSGAVKVKIDENFNIGVVFGHLDHKSEELREQQIKRVLDKTRDFLFGTPHLICGDFNTFQKSDCHQGRWKAILDLYQTRGWPAPPERSLVLDALQKAGYQDTFFESLKYGTQSGERTLPDPTAWTDNPLMRIDHVLVKNPGTEQTISTKRHYRIDSNASDHFPVVVEVEMGE